MSAIQILMDDKIISALDQEAKNQQANRSKLIRRAVDHYLEGIQRARLEDQHRRGYEVKSQENDDITPWQDIQAWPES